MSHRLYTARQCLSVLFPNVRNRPSVACLLHWRAKELIPYVRTGPRKRYRFDASAVYAALFRFPNQFAPYAQCPRCADEPPVIEWNLGPAGGGEGTAGRDLWQDGETLLIARRTSKGNEYEIVRVRVNETEVRFLDECGDELGFDPDSVYWWARV